METPDRRIELSCSPPKVILPILNGSDDEEAFSYRHLYGCVNSIFDGTDTTPKLVFYEDRLEICSDDGGGTPERPEVHPYDEFGKAFGVMPREMDGRKEILFDQLFNILRSAGSNGSIRAVPDFNILPCQDHIKVW
jgi:hypothetical protein